MLLICNSYPEVKLLWCSEVSQMIFFSYLENRTQFFTINSDIKEINLGVTQGSILGTLLFLIYINYLNYSVKFCKFYHFADDTNLINFNCSIRVNIGLKI